MKNIEKQSYPPNSDRSQRYCLICDYMVKGKCQADECPVRGSSYAKVDSGKHDKLILLASMIILCCLSCAIAHPAEAGYVVVPGASSGSFNVKVTSMKEAHFRTTVRQQYGFSCGSAV